MTSKLKCPFCQTELEYDVGYDGDYSCRKCGRNKMFGSEELWQALIQSQKDLEKLKERFSAREKKVLDWQMEAIVRNAELEIARNALEELWCATHYDTDGYLGKTIQRALEQIEHKEKHDGIPL